MTFSVALAARLADVPRSWLRRAIDRGDFRLDVNDRVEPADVPRIRQAHALALSLRGRRDLERRTGRFQIQCLQDLTDSIDDLGALAGNAVSPDEARKLLEDFTVLADTTGHADWARALQRAVDALGPTTTRAAERRTKE